MFIMNNKMHHVIDSPSAAKFKREKKGQPLDWIISADGRSLVYIGKGDPGADTNTGASTGRNNRNLWAKEVGTTVALVINPRPL